MKIGILTFHVAHNYGAVLQAYALQNYLINLGHDAVIIDYQPEKIVMPYKLITFPPLKKMTFFKKIRRLLGNLFNLCLIPLRFLRRKAFNKFIFNSLVLENFNKNFKYESYDVYIFGSDQIWNIEMVGLDEMYFGRFHTNSNQLKIAYAASAGKGEDLICNNKEALDAINNLDFVSVRESTLKRKLETKIDKKISIVLDPTLLVNPEIFEKILKKPIIKKKYLLIYKMISSTILDKIADGIANRNSFQVIELLSSVSAKPLLNIERNKMFESPDLFLGWFRYADCIVTTSFHGVAFSLVFRKSFYFVSSGHPAENRIISLLEQLELSNRIITGDMAPDFTEIDYASLPYGKPGIEDKLFELQKKSRDFIKIAIEKRDGN